MVISELITHLAALEREFGNLPVFFIGHAGAICEVETVRITGEIEHLESRAIILNA